MAVQQLEAALEGVRFGVEHQLNVRRSIAPDAVRFVNIFTYILRSIQPVSFWN